MRGPLLRRRGLSFPGINSGFDPSHVAANNARFSGVASNAVQFRNLLTGHRANTVNGTPAFVMDGLIGPSVQFGVSPSDSLDFTGAPSVTDANFTIAAIFRTNTPSGDFCAWFSGSITNYQMYHDQSTNNLAVQGTIGGGGVTSTLPIADNTYYFAAVSVSPTVSNFVTTRLDTGSIRTGTGASPGSAAGTGTWEVGANAQFSQTAKSQIATAMASGTFLTIPQLRAWAADPWSYWYPTLASVVAFDPAFVSVPAAVIPPSAPFSGPVFSDFGQVTYDTVILS